MIEIRQSGSADSALESALVELWPQVLRGAGAGFARLIEADPVWEEVDRRLEQCRGVDKVLVVGIGGSSLGTQVIYECFHASRSASLFFLEGVDRYRWDRLRDLGGDWRDRHVVLVSKSGRTLETLAWIEKLASVDKSWINKDQCTVVASPTDGFLQSWAGRHELPCLWLPEDVGGRFSVLSPVGMYPAGLMGLGCAEFRQGARWALAHPEAAARLASAAILAWSRGEWVTQLWCYAEALHLFGSWWMQLWSESLAKATGRKGQKAPRVSTPQSCLGSRDQHSLLQQLVEGHRDKQVVLTRVREVEAAGESFTAREFPEMPFYQRAVSLGGILGAEAQAFAQVLESKGLPLTTVELNSVNERSLGALFMLWQMTTAILGEHLDIDAFNQPGVELGKQLTEKILRQ